jgi:spore maturation protein CgeB
MELISENNTVEITVKFIGVDAWNLEITSAACQISGLAITDYTTLGYEIENRY